MIQIHESTVLFKVGNFSIQTWGSIVALGILIGLILILMEAGKKKLAEKTEAMLVFMIIFGLIFGRFAYIIINPDEFSNFISYINLFKGGVISWGVLIGVIFGIFTLKFLAKIKSDEFYKIIDLMAPYLVLAVGIGRIGCFLRGCCFGLPTNLPWGVLYSEHSLAAQAGLNTAIHPTQIYHMSADFIIFFMLLKLYKKKEKINYGKMQSKYSFFKIPGSIFLMFLILYSAERFFIDFLRYHPSNEYFILSITQWIFLVVFIVSFILLKTIKEKKK